MPLEIYGNLLGDSQCDVHYWFKRTHKFRNFGYTFDMVLQNSGSEIRNGAAVKFPSAYTMGTLLHQWQGQDI